jgi:hypothetical protein
MALLPNWGVELETIQKNSIKVVDNTGTSPDVTTGYGSVDTRYPSTAKADITIMLFPYRVGTVEEDEVLSTPTVIAGANFLLDTVTDGVYRLVFVILPNVASVLSTTDFNLATTRYLYDTVAAKVVKIATKESDGEDGFIYTYEDAVTDELLDAALANQTLYYMRLTDSYINKANSFSVWQKAKDKDKPELEKLFNQFKVHIYSAEVARAKSDWTKAANSVNYAIALVNCSTFCNHCK